jgi:hypothetical protein
VTCACTIIALGRDLVGLVALGIYLSAVALEAAIGGDQ